ncbi:MAG: hypothetical protein K0R63_1333 [Rickettsiales bacterium]|jgi:hypothetical protein|nr:hypothetical protein [Rickettsiales bacterium]
MGLMEVYGKEGNKISACSYLRKAKNSYVKEVVPSPKYAPNGEGYKHFFNPIRREHPFKKFDELIDYYNEQLGCNLK